MGFYDVVCGLSGVSLLSQDAELVLLRKTKKGYALVGLPVKGSYNRLGSIDVDETPWTDAMWAAVQKLLTAKTIEIDEDPENLEEFFGRVERTAIGEGCVFIGGDSLGFMLIQSDVCDAAIETAEKDGSRAADLKKLSVPELVERAFGGLEPGPALVASMLAKKKLENDVRKQLVRVLQVQAWMAKHGARWDVSDEAGQHGGEEIEETLDEAAKQFAKSPLLLAALEKCRENAADLLDDDEDADD
jgi:hypothetical protein